MAHNTLEFAKSQLEWMNDTLIKELELSRDRDNPFSVRCEVCSLNSTQGLPGPAGWECPLPKGQHVHSAACTCLVGCQTSFLVGTWAANQRQQG